MGCLADCTGPGPCRSLITRRYARAFKHPLFLYYNTTLPWSIIGICGIGADLNLLPDPKMTFEDMIDVLPPPCPLKLKEVITIVGGTPPSSAMFIEKAPRLEMECVDVWNWKRGPSFFGSGGEPWAYLPLSKQKRRKGISLVKAIVGIYD